MAASCTYLATGNLACGGKVLERFRRDLPIGKPCSYAGDCDNGMSCVDNKCAVPSGTYVDPGADVQNPMHDPMSGYRSQENTSYRAARTVRRVDDREYCARLCDDWPKCRGFSFGGSECELVRSLKHPADAPGTTTYVKKPRR